MNELFNQIHELATAYESGDITASQLDVFEDLLLNNPEARRIYLSYTSDTINLHWQSHRDQAVNELSLESLLNQPPARRPSLLTTWLVPGSIAAFFSLAVSIAFIDRNNTLPTETEPVDRYIINLPPSPPQIPTTALIPVDQYVSLIGDTP